MARVQCFHPSCHCSFVSEASMLQHFNDRHYHNQNKLPCPRAPTCNRSFSTKEGLEEHLRSPAHQLNQRAASDLAAAAAADNELVTPAILPCPCAPCDIFFTRTEALEEHLRAPPHQLNQRDAAAAVADAILLQYQQVACNDCSKLLKSTDSLHQHQWDCAGHTRVSQSPIPNPGSRVRACSQCGEKFGSANHLEDHFMDQHPISEVPESSEERTWQIIADRFESAWMKPTIKLDKVHRIYKVYNTGKRRKEFEEYRRELKNDMTTNQGSTNQMHDDTRKRVLKDGNEQTRYHGTTVKCRLGRCGAGEGGGEVDGADSMSASLCTSTDCSLCRILQVGFKKSKCKADKFQRYGIGIYTSSVSSKADAYVKCSSSSSSRDEVKVMMECKVLVGRPHHYTKNAQDLEGPPMGYHSVQGVPGAALNYEELVVYDDRAILPEFIILYSTTDPSTTALVRLIRFFFS